MEVKEAPKLHDFEPSVWEWLSAPDGGQPVSIADLIRALETHPEFRSAALLRSIDRVRDCLDQLPTHTDIDAPQEVWAGDLVVLIRALLTRFR